MPESVCREPHRLPRGLVWDDWCELGSVDDDLDWARACDVRGGLRTLPCCAPGPGDACDTDGERAARLARASARIEHGDIRRSVRDCL